jgi:hypothetical protein
MIVSFIYRTGKPFKEVDLPQVPQKGDDVFFNSHSSHEKSYMCKVWSVKYIIFNNSFERAVVVADVREVDKISDKYNT